MAIYEADAFDGTLTVLTNNNRVVGVQYGEIRLAFDAEEASAAELAILEEERENNEFCDVLGVVIDD